MCSNIYIHIAHAYIILIRSGSVDTRGISVAFGQPGQQKGKPVTRSQEVSNMLAGAIASLQKASRLRDGFIRQSRQGDEMMI